MEQFICRPNDDGTINEVLKEVATIEDTEDTTSEHMLLWAHRAEAQGVQNQHLMT